MLLTTKVLGALLAISLLGIGIQSVRLDRAQDYHKDYVAEIQNKLVEAYKKNNAANVAAQETQAALDVEYQRGKDDAKKLGDAVASNLRADNERLQKHWRAALQRANTAKTAAANSGGDDEAGQLRADLEGFVRRAAEGDAKIVRLQNRIDGYLKQVNGVGWYERYARHDGSSGSSYHRNRSQDRTADYSGIARASFGLRGEAELGGEFTSLSPSQDSIL